ncbi:hypothetical protein PIROE2DRAFT_16767, partial [Piromyces sp. E2]
ERYFVNYNAEEAISQNRIIKCTGSRCVKEQYHPGFYLDGSFEDVKTETGEDEEETTTTFNIQLIYCTTDDGCNSINKDSEGTALVDGYYLDASTYNVTMGENGKNVTVYKGLIKCEGVIENEEVIGYSCAKVESSNIHDGYYLNAINGDDDKFTNALIKCSEGQCNAYTVPGEANSIFVNEDTGKLIQCFDTTSSSGRKRSGEVTKGCNAFASTATLEVPVFYLNAAATNDTTVAYKDDIIRCGKFGESEEVQCQILDGANEVGEYSVFVNGNLNGASNGLSDDDAITNTDSTATEQLIICSGNTCEAVESTVASDTGYDHYYVNAGVYTTTEEEEQTFTLIKCTYDTSATVCSPVVVPTMNGTEMFFINGNYDLDTAHYLVKCTSLTTCTPYGTTPTPESDGTVEYFVYGAPDTDDPLVDAVLTVTHGSSAATDTSSSGRKREGDDPTTPTTPNITFTLVRGEANDIYINAFTHNLIQCFDASNAGSGRNVRMTREPPKV